MSVELITVIVTVIGIGTGLGGLIVTGQNGLRRDMREQRAENQAEFKAVREQTSALQARAARVEGLLEGLLREASIGRRPAPEAEAEAEAEAVAEDPGPYDKT